MTEEAHGHREDYVTLREFLAHKADAAERVARMENTALLALEKAERAAESLRRLAWAILSAVAIAVLKGAGVV